MAGISPSPPPPIGLIGWLLILLRVLLIVLLLLACLPFYYIWRLLHLHRFWTRVFLRGLGRIAGLSVRVKGTPHHNALLVANHVSWLDIPGIAYATGTAFVGHDGLASTPVIRHLCAMNDTVFIARHQRANVSQQVEQVRIAIMDTDALTIFPEGTTSDGTGLLPFKSALLSAADPLPDGIAVQPVLLEYEDSTTIAWVGAEHGVDNFKRILARLRPVRLTLHFLPELAGEALENRKTIAAAAHYAIAEELARG